MIGRPVGALLETRSDFWLVADAGFRPLREACGQLVAYVNSREGEAMARDEAERINRLTQRFWEGQQVPERRVV